jgi:hypothetical protein
MAGAPVEVNEAFDQSLSAGHSTWGASSNPSPDSS